MTGAEVMSIHRGAGGTFYSRCLEHHFDGPERPWNRRHAADPNPSSAALALAQGDALEHNIAHHSAVRPAPDDVVPFEANMLYRFECIPHGHFDPWKAGRAGWEDAKAYAHDHNRVSHNGQPVATVGRMIDPEAVERAKAEFVRMIDGPDLAERIRAQQFTPEEAAELVGIIEERTMRSPALDVRITVNHDETIVTLAYLDDTPPAAQWLAGPLVAAIMNFDSEDVVKIEAHADGRTFTAHIANP